MGEPEATLQMERVLRSRVFARAARSQRFLRYLVTAALAEPPRTLKEYTVAIEVFDRDSSYDPSVDATVRVEASRLRSRLREYYDGEGKHDSLLIEVPKGAYSAVLSRRALPDSAIASTDLFSPAFESQPNGVSTVREISGITASPFQAPLLLSDNAASAPAGRRFPPRQLRVLLTMGCLLLLACGAFRLAGRPNHQPVIHSMAVLPLKNLSGDPGQDYFADGTTDELITELARIPELRVLSWNSVEQEKGTRKPLRTIAGELQADAIVEGSVLRSGDSVRINVQLIDTRSDNHLWASSFEGRASEIMRLEDRAAQEIALHARLALASATAPGRGSPIVTIDPAAHDAYLRGRNYFDKREARASAEAFQHAIDLVPNYAPAYVGLAEALESEALLQEAETQEAVPRAMAAAQRALELEPENGDALIARGSIEVQFLWQWQAAERDLSHGVALSPSNSYGQMMLSIYFDGLAKPEEAVAHMQRAVEIDPLSFLMARHYGSTLFYARRYDEALRQLEYAREMHPAAAGVVDGWISASYEKKGMLDQAVRYDLLALQNNRPAFDGSGLRDAYKHSGWRAYWIQRREHYSDTKPSDPCFDYFAGLAEIRAGHRDQAFAAFKHAINQRCYWMVMLPVNPLLDELREDARFGQLESELRLPR